MLYHERSRSGWTDQSSQHTRSGEEGLRHVDLNRNVEALYVNHPVLLDASLAKQISPSIASKILSAT